MSSSAAQSEENPDLFLIRQIRAGDQRAWRQLIERYQGRLLAFARSRLGDGAEAEDALQETLMGFVSSLRHLLPDRAQQRVASWGTVKRVIGRLLGADLVALKDAR